MILTGKCKEDFEKWFNESDIINLNILHIINIGPFDRVSLFYKLPMIMQVGVYQSFFESLDVFSSIICYEIPSGDFVYKYEIIGFYGNYESSISFADKEIAIKLMIEMCIELINE